MPALASVIAAATVSAVCTRPLATTSSPTYSVSPSSRTRVPSLTLVNTSGPDVVDQRDARLDQQLRARGWGTGR